MFCIYSNLKVMAVAQLKERSSSTRILRYGSYKRLVPEEPGIIQYPKHSSTFSSPVGLSGVTPGSPRGCHSIHVINKNLKEVLTTQNCSCAPRSECGEDTWASTSITAPEVA